MVLILAHRGVRRGFGLVEIVVGASIISLVVLSVSFFFQKTLEVSNATTLTVQASYLLEAGVELAQYMRGETWTSYFNNTPIGALPPATKYYYSWNGARWGLYPYYIQNGIFVRTISTQPISRDSVTGEIVPPWTPTAVYDPNTKEITVAVEWAVKGASSSTVSVTTYLTNIFQLF